MPNIGALLQGYDVMFGNPVPTRGLPLDPGYRQPVFSAIYFPGDLTPDRRYKQPNGTTISSCSGTCSMDFESKEIAGTQSYQTTLSGKVSLSGGGWGAKFSASTDFKHVAEGSSSSKTVTTHSEATCCAYQAKILTYTPPELHPNFLAGIKQLPESYDASKYFKFIEAFGTHYVTELNMGAVFGQQSSFTTTAWSQMLSDGLDISAAASYSGFGASAAGSVQVDSEKQQAHRFSSASSEQRMYSQGAKPPADGKTSTWIQETIGSPAPMYIKLEQLHTLLDDAKFPLLGAVRTVKANLQQALKEYCEFLRSGSAVESCAAPDADPPFPQRGMPWKGTWTGQRIVVESLSRGNGSLELRDDGTGSLKHDSWNDRNNFVITRRRSESDNHVFFAEIHEEGSDFQVFSPLMCALKSDSSIFCEFSQLWGCDEHLLGFCDEYTFQGTKSILAEANPLLV